MGKAKTKMWLVELDPPKATRLPARAAGESRTAVRNYLVQAASRSEAQSIVEEQERAIEEQTGEPVWKVGKVGAA